MTKKTLRRITTTALALVLTLGITAAPASAADKTAKATVSKETGRKTISVKKLSYDLKDNDENISIDFKTKVNWKSSSKATVKDSAGKSYTVRIEDRDSDEIDLYVKKLAAGKDYTIVFSGVKAKNDSAYGKLTVKFSIPAASTSTNNTLKLEEIEYDYDDRELSLDFKKSITLDDSATVTLKDSSGKNYRAKIVGSGSDEVEIRVLDKLNYGSSYTVTVTKIKVRSASSYTSFSQTFRAIDD